MTLEEVTKKVGELETSLADSVTKQEELEKTNKRQEAVIKLSAEERVVFDALPVEKQDAFLTADVEARKAYAPDEEDEDDELSPAIAKRLADIEATHKADIAK